MNKNFKSRTIILSLIAFLTTISITVNAQSISHPHIWVDNNSKQEILDNIANHGWAEQMFNQLKQRQDARVNAHKSDPATLVNQIEPIPGDRDRHRVMLNNGVECAILYYLTGNEDYAQVTADILQEYVRNIQGRDPEQFLFFDRGRSDDFLIQTREDHPRVGIMYDFVEPFLRKSTTRVYNKASGSIGRFGFTNAQNAFEVLARNVLDRGGMNSNHSILELPGLLYSILCIKDDTKREELFQTMMDGKLRQDGIYWMMNHFTEKEGMWPESMGYSKGTHTVFLWCLNVIDKYKPSLRLIENNTRLLDGIFIFENFNYPNDQMMAFGDANRNASQNDNSFRILLAIAHRKNMSTYKTQAMSVLKTLYDKQGGYDPQIVTQRLEWWNPLQLIWGVNIPATINSADIPLYSTLEVDFAGVVMQRNYVENSNKDHALMYYTGGANYVHAHASGIDMELYGRGHVMVPDYGNATYGTELHEQYAVAYAAHNTVIVNGESARGPKTNGNSTWQNIVDDVVLQGVEPAFKEDPISENYSFSTQYLDDQWNDCKQLRSNAIIRTSETTGYYFDMFRSVSNGTNNFHDYLIHGLGDAMSIKSNGSNVSLNNTPNRYQNDIGDDRKQPGWRYFSDAETSSTTSNAIQTRFDLNATNDYLHVNVPGSINREYTSALAPSTKYAGPYTNKDTRMFIMRKNGEAWDQPFVALFEPSGNANSSIQSTELLKQGGKVVGVKVVSRVNGKDIIDFILSTDRNGTEITLNDYDISFKGRFGIVRSIPEPGREYVELYMGKGANLTYKGETLEGGSTFKGFTTFEIVNRVGPEGFVYVTDERGTVTTNKPIDIAYGVDGQFNYLYNQRSDLACTNDVFGDPFSGRIKSCYVRESKTHYGIEPMIVPGVIEAEFYDYGGKNISFFDLSDVNKGAPEASFRTENGVDIGRSGDVMAIGWIGNDEWTEYTINVSETGVYELTFHVSSDNSNGRMGLNIDGIQALTSIAVPNTGSLDNYSTFTEELNLTEGQHVLRINYETGGFELDKLVAQEKVVTALSSAVNSKYKIHPNPSSNIFILNKPADWELFSIRGETLLSGSGLKVDLANFESGIYLLRLNDEVIRIIKQ